MALDKNEFSIFAVQYVSWLKGIRKLAPPPPPGFFWVLHQGAPSGIEKDYPLNPLFSAFNVAMTGHDDKDLIPMWSVYFQSIYKNGKKVPVKALASQLGVSPRHFYDMATEMAEKLYRRAFVLVGDQHHWERFAENYFD